MFDLRYHVASLAAVFIAIAVGIVIGVAIASGGGVEKATLDQKEAQIRDLEADRDAAREQAQVVQDRSRASTELVENAYPALMSDRLAGKNIALLCLGGIDNCERDDVEQMLTDAGAGGPVRVTSLQLPADEASLMAVVEADPTLAAFGYKGGLEGLGGGLGREFVSGADTPTWDAVKDIIAEQVFGSPTPADGVVVVRGWEEPEAGASAEEQQAAISTGELLTGLLAGIEDSGVPVVGVEALRTDPSTVPFFRDNGLSTVNDVETDAGRLALALLLAGGEPGSYGAGDEVDGVTPPIEPLPAATVAG